MAVPLTPNTKIDSLKKRLGYGNERQKLRQSKERQRYLEKVARMTSKQGVKVILHAGGAKCRPNQDSTDRRSEYDIFIPAQEFDQPETDLPPKSWDLLFQETELVHELGHVLYTDFDALVSTIENEVDRRYQSLFKDVSNAAEDGRIETQLAERFNVEDDLTVKNANLAELSNQTRQRGGTVGGTVEYNLKEAITIGLLDMGYHDSGRFAAMLDEDDDEHVVGQPLGIESDVVEVLNELRPLMADFMSDTLAIRDGGDAVDRTYEFWVDDLKPTLEELIDKAEDQQNREERPDDADAEISNDPQEADELPDQDGAQVQVQQSSATQDPEEESDEDAEDGAGGAGEETDEDGDEEQGAGGAGDAAEPEEDGEESDDAGDVSGGDAGQDDQPEEGDGVRTDDTDAQGGGEDQGPEMDSETDGDSEDEEDGGAGDEDLDDIEEDVKQKYQREVKNEQDQQQGQSPEEKEAKALVRLMQGGGDGTLSTQKANVLGRDDYRNDWDRDRWVEAKRKGAQLEETFERRLQRERMASERHGEKSGRLDSQRLYQVEAGTDRVFRRTERGEEKKYSCSIILDRSGSMGSEIMPAAEGAVGMLTSGLEGVGVDTSIISILDSEPVVEKPFNSEAEDYAPNTFRNYSVGGTPLSGALELARERLEGKDGDHFVIVITDGRPDDQRKYQDELDMTQCPVLGVYVDEAGANHSGRHHAYFDVVKYATPKDVSKKVRELAEGVMF